MPHGLARRAQGRVGLSPLARAQQVALVAAVVCGGLGLLASVGVFVLPPVSPGWAVPGHLVLLLLGICTGLAAVRRQREIDRQRWQAVADPLLTKGEREYAHREAESERRMAATAFLLAPVALGYWMAYQLQAAGLVVYLLPASPLLGFATGFVLPHLRRRQD